MFGAREFLTHPVGVLFLTCSSFTVSPMAGQLTFGTRTQSQCDGNKSLSQIGSSRYVCVAVCRKSMERPNTLRSVTETR